MDYIPAATPAWLKPEHLAPLVRLLAEARHREVRALISVPPQFGKSQTVLHGCVKWFEEDPSDKIIYSSYNQDIANSQSRTARDIATRVRLPLRDDAAAVSPDSWAVSATGTPAIDVAAGVSAQLAEHGIPVLRVPGCTRESPHLYSYRRDGRTGRFAGLIRLHRMPRGDFRSWQVLSDGAAPSGAGLGRK